MPHKETRAEHSFGSIPLKQIHEVWHVFMVQHGCAKYWGFPKGHAEEGETPLETATRELMEETSLNIVRVLHQTPFEEHYEFTTAATLVFKTVSFFVCEVEGEVSLQEAEVSDGRWVPLNQAEQLLTYATDKSICHKVRKLLEIEKLQ